jgi:hypothetical protein
MKKSTAKKLMKKMDNSKFFYNCTSSSLKDIPSINPTGMYREVIYSKTSASSVIVWGVINDEAVVRIYGVNKKLDVICIEWRFNSMPKLLANRD